MSPRARFDPLFEAAIKRWPAVVEIDFEISKPIDGRARWSTPTLYDLVDARPERDLISIQLDHAIFVSLHAIAPRCRRIRLDDLRREPIRELFEANLESSLGEPAHVWPAEEIAAARAYLATD